MKVAILFVILCGISQAIAAEDLLEDIYERTEDAQASYIPPPAELQYTPEKYKDYELTEQDLIKSGTFLGVIPKGTTLFNMAHKDKLEVINKEVIVRAFKKKDFLGHQILLNNDGSTTYKVHFSDIQHMNAITQMYEEPLEYKPVEQKLVYNHEDKQFGIQNEFNFSMGIVSSSYTKDILDEKSLNMKTFHYDAITYAKWDFDILLGILLGVESNIGSTTRGFKIYDNSLMIGPSIKAQITSWNEAPVYFIGTFKTSLLSRMTVSNSTDSANYRANKQALKIGLQTEYSTKILGNILFGAHVQRTWIKAKSDQYQIDLNRQVFFDDAFLVNIGFQKDWIW